MTIQHLVEPPLAEEIPAIGLLEGLERIHRWMLVIDSRRRVIWKSAALSEFAGVGDLIPGDDARDFLARLPRPEQVFPLRTSLRGRSHHEGVPLDLELCDGTPISVDLGLVRIEAETGDLLLVIASEHLDPSQGGPDAELLESLPEAVLSVDADGFVRRANQAALRLLEAPADLVISRPVTTLLADAPEAMETIGEALVGRTELVRLGVRRADGSERSLDVTVTPLSRGMRSLVLKDASATHRAERRLEQASDELDHCIGALAHDLRSPLVGLLGFSRLLRQDYEDALDDTGRHFVDRIEQAARTMESLIHDLLELARIGEPGEVPSLVNPREVLQQLGAELKTRLESAGIELVQSDEFASRVYCDRSRLYQLFSNLIGNAIQHMGPRAEARIEVSIEESEHGHEIVVRDNGRGVPLQDQARIFEIFQSLGTRADGARSTGMGLAIVKKIAEKYGGRVWLESQPGAGASFHVTLPRR